MEELFPTSKILSKPLNPNTETEREIWWCLECKMHFANEKDARIHGRQTEHPIAVRKPDGHREV